MRRPVLAALLAAAALLGCAGPRTSWRASPLVGKTVGLGAKGLDGREVRLPARGARVTVVDFWATWCDPCRDQMPALDQLAAAYREQGVEVYAVSFDEDRAGHRRVPRPYAGRLPGPVGQGGRRARGASST